MQNMWRERREWDKALSSQSQLELNKYSLELNDIKSVVIPQWIGSEFKKEMHLRGFTDATTKAYGACLYLYVQ